MAKEKLTNILKGKTEAAIKYVADAVNSLKHMKTQKGKW